MLAVIKTGGKQYLVKEGDVLKIEKLQGKEGEKIFFDQVLLLSNEKEVEIGKPFLERKIEGEIKEQGRGEKITMIKYKRKVRYRIKKGHRQLYTKVEIKSMGK